MDQLYGAHLDWGYFDHPALVGWIQGLFLHLFGKGELWARLPAILISALTSLLCWKALGPYLRDPGNGLWALVGLNASLGFSALSLMLLPDSILFSCTFLFVATAERVQGRGILGDWLAFGVATRVWRAWRSDRC
jgi:4-amino-4-deoxy-L-arabinose transferase-like glycosyltransferase